MDCEVALLYFDRPVTSSPLKHQKPTTLWIFQRLKHAACCAVEVIHRCLREHTMENTMHIDIYISRISIEHYLKLLTH